MFAKLTAHTYRHGEGSRLGARYERLMNEARRIGYNSGPLLSKLGAIGMSTAASYVDVTELDMITETSREG